MDFVVARLVVGSERLVVGFVEPLEVDFERSLAVGDARLVAANSVADPSVDCAVAGAFVGRCTVASFALGAVELESRLAVDIDLVAGSLEVVRGIVVAVDNVVVADIVRFDIVLMLGRHLDGSFVESHWDVVLGNEPKNKIQT